MFKLYTVTKKKTKILGLWKDKEKIYRDRIKIKSFNAMPRKEIAELFSQGEKAVFYTWGCNAICLYSDYTKTIFSHCITWKEKKLRLSLVKALLVQHGGLTIYKNENDYTIEIWKA